ncbi:MAG: hypothetical protein KY476_20540 [Planctomycetes bacterium]|nr:hypothetical protein [Planctomycetota bacterium]
MRMRFLPTLAAYVVALTSPAAKADNNVEPDKENVVASRLEGDWRIDAALTKRLTEGERAGAWSVVSFTSDPGVVAKIAAKYERALTNKRVYLAGTLTLKGGKPREHPFLLVENSGNPHVVYFRERDGDPLGDTESFNVMLASAKERENDLLFIGGDFNNQPFSAYARAKVENKK